MGADAARAPLDDAGAGQGRQDDILAGSATLCPINVDVDGQMIQSEVEHGLIAVVGIIGTG